MHQQDMTLMAHLLRRAGFGATRFAALASIGAALAHAASLRSLPPRGVWLSQPQRETRVERGA